MYFANTGDGKRIHIGDAKPHQQYYCPACGESMVQKRGNINAHHFAHKSKKCCDPWYTGKLSAWHEKMQSFFRANLRERVIWNIEHNEFHIADIALNSENGKIVIEFQHSEITQREFISRTRFYMCCGYTVIWVFDFCQCKNPKTVYIDREDTTQGVTHLVWPGRDRIRFLDNADLPSYSDQLHIVFHISTGKGRPILHNTADFSWETWEYLDPFHRDLCFAYVYINDFTDFSSFSAKCYSEDAFYKWLEALNRKY